MAGHALPSRRARRRPARRSRKAALVVSIGLFASLVAGMQHLGVTAVSPTARIVAGEASR